MPRSWKSAAEGKALGTPSDDDTVTTIEGGAWKRSTLGAIATWLSTHSALTSAFLPLDSAVDASDMTIAGAIEDEDSATSTALSAHYQPAVVVRGVGDGVADDTDAINEAAALVPTNGRLYLPAVSVGYNITEGLDFDGTFDVWCDSPIIYNGPGEEPALSIGVAGATHRHRRHRLSVKMGTPAFTDWLDEDDVGVRLINHVSCSNIEVVLVQGFTVGLQLMGDAAGFAYNTMTIGELANNKVHLDITSIDSGYCSENLILGGRWRGGSTTNVLLDRIGVRIGGNATSTNNTFLKPSFEINGTSAEALSVLITNGRGNHIIEARSEGNSVTFARIQNDVSTLNTFTIGRDEGSIPSTIDDQTTGKTNVLSGGIWNPPPIVKLADETINNSDVLQDDNELKFWIGPRERWVFDFHLMVASGTTGATADFVATIDGPSGATLVAMSDGPGTTATVSSAMNRTARLLTALGAGQQVGLLDSLTVPVTVRGTILASTTAGFVTLKWAQNAATATDTTVKAGSSVRRQRVA